MDTKEVQNKRWEIADVLADELAVWKYGGEIKDIHPALLHRAKIEAKVIMEVLNPLVVIPHPGAELPLNPYVSMAKETIQTVTSPHYWAYKKAQEDMIKEGFINTYRLTEV